MVKTKQILASPPSRLNSPKARVYLALYIEGLSLGSWSI